VSFFHGLELIDVSSVSPHIFPFSVFRSRPPLTVAPLRGSFWIIRLGEVPVFFISLPFSGVDRNRFLVRRLPTALELSRCLTKPTGPLESGHSTRGNPPDISPLVFQLPGESFLKLNFAPQLRGPPPFFPVPSSNYASVVHSHVSLRSTLFSISPFLGYTPHLPRIPREISFNPPLDGPLPLLYCCVISSSFNLIGTLLVGLGSSTLLWQTPLRPSRLFFESSPLRFSTLAPKA